MSLTIRLIRPDRSEAIEYPLRKPTSIVGRSWHNEYVDVDLSHDRQVSRFHA